MSEHPIRTFFRLRRSLRNPEAVFNVMENMGGEARAENTFIAPLQLVQRDGQFTFQGPSSTPAVVFMRWFRWVFLLFAIGLGIASFQAMRGEVWFVNALAWMSLFCAVGMGLLGTFVVFPLFRRLIQRADQMTGKWAESLPSFDLRAQVLRLPDMNSALPVSQLKGYGLCPGVDGWIQLRAYTQEGQSVFLVNYPTSAAKSARQHGAQIAQCTGLDWLGDCVNGQRSRR